MTDWAVPATVIRVVDGDTIVIRADLGWHIELETSVRIAGINAPELNTQAGQNAKAYLEERLRPGAAGLLVSKKLLGATDKYGRCLGDFITLDGLDVATDMLATGHAAPYNP